ncbi:MAG: metalloregulator ArsR/SmtB family transcription factor [Gemmatimonadales bacterium]
MPRVLPSPSELLVTLAEPTRLRILNCLAASPLFVSDLQVILGQPQPTVSRHLKVLRRLQLVDDTQIAQFVLYRLARLTGPRERLVKAVLDGIHHEERFKAERHRARDRARSHARRHRREGGTASTPTR